MNAKAPPLYPEPYSVNPIPIAMVLTTRVTKLLGIEHPIIQGGMHYVGYAGSSQILKPKPYTKNLKP
jgi:hypothetical protein